MPNMQDLTPGKQEIYDHHTYIAERNGWQRMEIDKDVWWYHAEAKVSRCQWEPPQDIPKPAPKEPKPKQASMF